MKKTLSRTSFDFFARYAKKQIHTYVFSGFCAFAIALSIVSASNGVTPTGLMANVAEIGKTTPVYAADLVLEKTQGGYDVVLWAAAEKVEVITLTLLGDPAHIEHVTTATENVMIQNDVPGVYRVSMKRDDENLSAGTVLAHLDVTMKDWAPIAVVDVGFSSHDGSRYDLSSEVK